jgi:hypothetical protein
MSSNYYCDHELILLENVLTAMYVLCKEYIELIGSHYRDQPLGSIDSHAKLSYSHAEYKK